MQSGRGRVDDLSRARGFGDGLGNAQILQAVPRDEKDVVVDRRASFADFILVLEYSADELDLGCRYAQRPGAISPVARNTHVQNFDTTGVTTIALV